MLNTEQKEASRADTGYSLILAGAGTGKTATLTAKISAVIEEKLCRPEEIILLTFSRAAAEEMTSRIRKRVSESEGIRAGTFHSVALSFLREYSREWMELKGFNEVPSVLDDEKKNSLMSEIIKSRIDSFLGLPSDTVMWLCSPRNTAKAARHKGFALIQNEIETLARDFAKLKKEKSLIDFDDIIADFTELLACSERAREGLKRFRYIFIDEFQDISDSTLLMVKTMLSVTGGNLCSVGDDAQAIYSFMGSVPDHIVSYRKHFPDARIYHLTKNYRSHSEVVSVANAIIARNSSALRKKLISHKGKGGRVIMRHSSNRNEEHGIIAEHIEKAGGSSESTAVLFRNNWQIARAEIFLREKEIEKNDRTVLTTIHASKGLEYDTVILAGIEDGIFPGLCSDEEEERRLLYVALTRAKKQLIIICSRDGDKIASYGKEISAAMKPFAGNRAVLYLDRTAARVSLLAKRIIP